MGSSFHYGHGLQLLENENQVLYPLSLLFLFIPGKPKFPDRPNDYLFIRMLLDHKFSKLEQQCLVQCFFNLGMLEFPNEL